MIVIGAAIVVTFIICDFLAIEGDTAAFIESEASSNNAKVATLKTGSQEKTTRREKRDEKVVGRAPRLALAMERRATNEGYRKRLFQGRFLPA